MMFIRARLASVGMSLEAHVPTEDRSFATEESLVFRLLPTDERNHLDLDTGEVFEDYYYARLRKTEKKLIDASITISPLPDDSYYQYNAMHYHYRDGTHTDGRPTSEICFTAFIEPAAFRELADNIKVGLFPDTISIEFDYRMQKLQQALEIGLDSGNWGMIWHNTKQENLTVPIKRVKFSYAILNTDYGKGLRRLPLQRKAPVVEQLAEIQTRLAKMSEQLRWLATLTLIVVVAYVTTILLKK